MGANLADDPISAVDAILSVHFNLALTSRLLASTDGLYRIGTGKVRCDTTRTTGDRARAGTCARGYGSLSAVYFFQVSSVSVLLENTFWCSDGWSRLRTSAGTSISRRVMIISIEVYGGTHRLLL